MRSFRVKQHQRQGSDQWGLDVPADSIASGESFQDTVAFATAPSSSSVYGGGYQQSPGRITVPGSEDRELSGGRWVNEEAVYNMRKKWISDRLIER